MEGFRQLTGLLVVWVLAGCGPSQQAIVGSQAQEAQFVFERDIAACREKFHNKPIMPRLKCEQATKAAFENAKARAIGRSDRDLVDLLHAKERAIAERYDLGQITQTQAEAELAQIRFETGTIVAQRDNATAASIDAQRQASAALFLAGAKMLTPPRPINTTCETNGRTTQCQTK